jgi:hypothetical protein
VTCMNIRRAVLAGLVQITGAGAKWIPGPALAAQVKPRSLPVFEVDRAWPKVPPKWKLEIRPAQCDDSGVNTGRIDIQGGFRLNHALGFVVFCS